MASENIDCIIPVSKFSEKKTEYSYYQDESAWLNLYFRKTSCNEVEKIISNLNSKKPYQQENIPTKIIKLIKDLIAKFIAETSNYCIDEREFPSELKHGDIIPTHKIAENSNKSNYRPVSILYNYSKVHEKLI